MKKEPKPKPMPKVHERLSPAGSKGTPDMTMGKKPLKPY